MAGRAGRVTARHCEGTQRRTQAHATTRGDLQKRRGADQEHSGGRAHAGQFRLVSGLGGRRRAAGQTGRQRCRCRRTHRPQPAADAAPPGCPPRPSSRLAGALRPLVRRRPDTSKCSSTRSSGAPTSKPFCSPRSAPSCRCAVSHPRRGQVALAGLEGEAVVDLVDATAFDMDNAHDRTWPARAVEHHELAAGLRQCFQVFLKTWVLRGAGAPGWRPGAGASCRAVRSSRAARRGAQFGAGFGPVRLRVGRVARLQGVVHAQLQAGQRLRVAVNVEVLLAHRLEHLLRHDRRIDLAATDRACRHRHAELLAARRRRAVRISNGRLRSLSAIQGGTKHGHSTDAPV